VKIAADANALLSAVLGGRANLILQHPEVDEVFTAEETLDEVQEYAAGLARPAGAERFFKLCGISPHAQVARTNKTAPR